MVRFLSETTEVTRPYVRVRIEDMKDVDLGLFTFDYGLTFCALILHADGTILHTYGGRDSSSPESHLSLASLELVLRAGLLSHRAHKPIAPLNERGPTIQELPQMARRIKEGKAPKCFHCHMVDDMRLEERRERKQLRRQDAFLWPDPVQMGVRLERDDQARVKQVLSGSPAEKAGLAPGDLLLALAGHTVATFGDIQRVLHRTDGGAARLELRVRRGQDEVRAELGLKSGWKEPDPATFAWRPTKWQLDPRPGFGGPALSASEKLKLGIPAQDFAFRVNYLVTWGEEARTGQNAAKAGLKKGDVVLSVDGKRDFESVDHFHAWVRLTKREGDTLDLETLRAGERRTLELRLLGAR